MLQPIYGGALARPFTTHYNALDRTIYLRIATELYLKRLIVGGLERVYEIGKDFRNEGLSPKHNPEFTMLEWYEAYADWEVVADRAERLVRHRRRARSGTRALRAAVEARDAGRRDRRRATGVDILANRTLESLQARDARAQGHARPGRAELGARSSTTCVSKYVEPTLIEPTILHDYPVELSPFAKRHREHDGPGRALRGLRGRDGDRQRLHRAQRSGRPAGALRGAGRATPRRATRRRSRSTRTTSAALEHGMPPTGGIGIGIDRLVMLLTGQRTIREVVLFPALK